MCIHVCSEMRLHAGGFANKHTRCRYTYACQHSQMYVVAHVPGTCYLSTLHCAVQLEGNQPYKSCLCMQVLAMHVQSATFDAFMEARRQRDEASIVAGLREQECKQASIAVAGAAPSDTVEQLRRRIVDEVLTLQCPRCGQAWNEFEACVAVKCGRCNAAFCGICMQDCGTDAHAHARTCHYVVRYTQGRATMNQHNIPLAQNDWRRFHLRRMLASTDQATAEMVLRVLSRELQDLGLDIGGMNEGTVSHNLEVRLVCLVLTTQTSYHTVLHAMQALMC